MTIKKKYVKIEESDFPKPSIHDFLDEEDIENIKNALGAWKLSLSFLRKDSTSIKKTIEKMEEF